MDVETKYRPWVMELSSLIGVSPDVVVMSLVAGILLALIGGIIWFSVGRQRHYGEPTLTLGRPHVLTIAGEPPVLPVRVVLLDAGWYYDCLIHDVRADVARVIRVPESLLRDPNETGASNGSGAEQPKEG